MVEESAPANAEDLINLRVTGESVNQVSANIWSSALKGKAHNGDLAIISAKMQPTDHMSTGVL